MMWGLIAFNIISNDQVLRVSLHAFGMVFNDHVLWAILHAFIAFIDHLLCAILHAFAVAFIDHELRVSVICIYYRNQFIQGCLP